MSDMVTNDPFATEGLWLRAALHSHTDASDGDLAPEAHVLHHEWAGFDVVAITDHWTLTRVASRRHILVLPGAELAVDPTEEGRDFEILAVGIGDLPEDPGGDRAFWRRIGNYEFRTFTDYPTAAAWIAAQGGVSYVCHPSWSGLPAEVVLSADGVTGIELYNASGERDCGRGDSSYVWDLALDAGRRLHAIATDDTHYPGFDIGDGWTMIRAAERSQEAVLEALRTGATYASAGPAIHGVERDGDAFEVHCSPAASVILQSRYELGWSVRADHRGRQEEARIIERDERGLITRASFAPLLEGGLPYGRVVIVDERGRKAWTNPIGPVRP